MSINRNRGKLSKAKSNREYNKILWDSEYGMYWDECVNYYPKYNRGTKKGQKKFWRKQKMSYQIRMYRTWKHNRKTRWK